MYVLSAFTSDGAAQHQQRRRCSVFLLGVSLYVTGMKSSCRIHFSSRCVFFSNATSTRLSQHIIITLSTQKPARADLLPLNLRQLWLSCSHPKHEFSFSKHTNSRSFVGLFFHFFLHVFRWLLAYDGYLITKLGLGKSIRLNVLSARELLQPPIFFQYNLTNFLPRFLPLNFFLIILLLPSLNLLLDSRTAKHINQINSGTTERTATL